MEATETRRKASPFPRLAIGLAMAAVVLSIGVAGLAGWLWNGDTLLWSLMQSGLSWCF